MQKDRAERLFPTSIEKELRFAKWCEQEGVKIFLLDLDDTLCPTRQVFLDVMSAAYDFLAENVPAVPREEWRQDVEAINNRLFEKVGVNPNRWNHVVDELAEKYSLPSVLKEETKQIFQQIYITPLHIFEGAEKGLNFISKVGIPVGVVTHANTEWTYRKYNWLGLTRWMDWDDIFIVDENGHKTPESWREATRYFRVSPGECAVVGDSPRSDINPAREIGVKHCFLVEDPKQWSVHNHSVDEDVKKISDLSQIAEIDNSG